MSSGQSNLEQSSDASCMSPSFETLPLSRDLIGIAVPNTGQNTQADLAASDLMGLGELPNLHPDASAVAGLQQTCGERVQELDLLLAVCVPRRDLDDRDARQNAGGFDHAAERQQLMAAATYVQRRG